MTRGNHPPPDWLEGRWADQKKSTATRIAAAVANLQKTGGRITYSSICQSVEALYGVSMSANTIKRNHAAYQLYSASRSTRRFSPVRGPEIQVLIQNAAKEEHDRLCSKIARLRRMRKDALIARLVQLEDASDRQKTIETNLRDEILRLLARAKSGGA
jgi:predicted neuraminidase